MSLETRAVNCKTFEMDGLGIGYVVKEFPQTLDKLYVIGAGDLHGDKHGIVRFKEIFDWARKKGARVILTGDMLNAATKHSVSHEHGSESLLEEIDRVEELISKNADLLDALVEGNHDFRAFKETGEDVLRRIAKNCCVPYHPDAMVVVYKLGKNAKGDRLVYTGYVTHSYRCGRKAGTKLQKVVDLKEVITADFYFAGHSHDLSTHKGGIITIDTRANSLSLKQQVFANCGAELPYVGYAVKHTFSPTKRGVVRLRLDGKRHDMHISI